MTVKFSKSAMKAHRGLETFARYVGLTPEEIITDLLLARRARRAIRLEQTRALRSRRKRSTKR